jgi:flagellar L-ring protein FlgH
LKEEVYAMRVGKVIACWAAALALCLSCAVASAQTRKGKKGDGERAAVQVADAPAAQPDVTTAEAAEAARPANGSLYSDDAANASLLSDFKPRRVGDLVFIDVVEQSAGSVESGAKRARDTGALGGLVGAIGAVPVPGAAVAGAVIGGLGGRKYEGKGSTNRTSNMRARIVARVTEVLPNGDLRLEAFKSVKLNKEHERLALSGVVRQRDVAADNSVPTTSVGDLRVELNGKGVASADNAPGWLYRLFEKIAPF